MPKICVQMLVLCISIPLLSMRDYEGAHMGIKLEWLDHPKTEKTKNGGIARFSIGGKYHHVQVDSVEMAFRLQKLLQHAHEAGVKKGGEQGVAYDHQRVRDLLSG